MKRDRVKGLARSDDKKARLEAGSDLAMGRDMVDLQLDQIVREVTPPAAVGEMVSYSL